VLDTVSISEFSTALTMMREHGLQLQQALDETGISHSLIEGSGFCAAASFDPTGQHLRGLLSPDEMSVNMAMMVLAHG
jgi:hypothetical protein